MQRGLKEGAVAVAVVVVVVGEGRKAGRAPLRREHQDQSRFASSTAWQRTVLAKGKAVAALEKDEKEEEEEADWEEGRATMRTLLASPTARRTKVVSPGLDRGGRCRPAPHQRR